MELSLFQPLKDEEYLALFDIKEEVIQQATLLPLMVASNIDEEDKWNAAVLTLMESTLKNSERELTVNQRQIEHYFQEMNYLTKALYTNFSSKPRGNKEFFSILFLLNSFFEKYDADVEKDFVFFQRLMDQFYAKWHFVHYQLNHRVNLQKDITKTVMISFHFQHKTIEEENILKALEGNKHLPPLMKELLMKIAKRKLEHFGRMVEINRKIIPMLLAISAPLPTKNITHDELPTFFNI
jgi:hypothetical protein